MTWKSHKKNYKLEQKLAHSLGNCAVISASDSENRLGKQHNRDAVRHDLKFLREVVTHENCGHFGELSEANCTATFFNLVLTQTYGQFAVNGQLCLQRRMLNCLRFFLRIASQLDLNKWWKSLLDLSKQCPNPSRHSLSRQPNELMFYEKQTQRLLRLKWNWLILTVEA